MNIFVKALPLAAFVYGALILFVQSASAPYTYDHFWHLQTGLDMLDGLYPTHDRYSFTFEGVALKQQPYPFQLAYAASVNILGFERGTQALLLAAGLLFIGCWLCLQRACKTHLIPASSAFLLACVFFAGRLIPRPELIDICFIPVAFAIYVIARENRHRPAFLLLAPLFTMLWTNYHAGILAYAIFIGLFIDILYLWSRERFAEWPYLAKILILGVLTLAAGWLNSDWQHPILQALQFSETWRSIAEHRSTLVHWDSTPALLSIWYVFFFVALWSLATKNYGLLVTAGIFTYASIDRVRMLPISAITFACMFLVLAGEAKSRLLYRRLRRHVRLLLIVSFFVAPIILVTQEPWLAVKKRPEHALDLPDNVVQNLSQRDGGNILNRLRHGGFLLYALPGDFKIFIDGRTNVLYPEQHFLLMTGIANGNPTAIAKVLAEYDVHYVVWPIEKPLHLALTYQTDFRAAYIGDSSILYTRDGKLHTLASLLTFPVCAESLSRAEAEQLLVNVDELRPKNRPLIELLETVAAEQSDLATSVSERDFIKGDIEVDKSLLRLLAYMAYFRGDAAQAADTLSIVRPQTSLDLLHYTYFELEADRPKQALYGLILLMSGQLELSGQKISPEQLSMFRALLERIDSEVGLNTFTRDMATTYFAESKGESFDQEFSLVPESFCSNLIAAGATQNN